MTHQSTAGWKSRGKRMQDDNTAGWKSRDDVAQEEHGDARMYRDDAMLERHDDVVLQGDGKCHQHDNTVPAHLSEDTGPAFQRTAAAQVSRQCPTGHFQVTSPCAIESSVPAPRPACCGDCHAANPVPGPARCGLCRSAAPAPARLPTTGETKASNERVDCTCYCPQYHHSSSQRLHTRGPDRRDHHGQARLPSMGGEPWSSAGADACCTTGAHLPLHHAVSGGVPSRFDYAPCAQHTLLLLVRPTVCLLYTGTQHEGALCEGGLPLR